MNSSSQISFKSKDNESDHKKLLEDLIKACENFLDRKDVDSLSESLKLIFYHGITLDKQVSIESNKVIKLHHTISIQSDDL